MSEKCFDFSISQCYFEEIWIIKLREKKSLRQLSDHDCYDGTFILIKKNFALKTLIN
jgi:hypothetical protein